MILAVLFAARAATGFQFQSVGSTATMLMRDLAIDYSGIGMLLGAYLLPGVIVAFPAGVLGQRFRDKTLGLIGLFLMAASAAVLGAAEGFAVALVARTIGGVGATISSGGIQPFIVPLAIPGVAGPSAMASVMLMTNSAPGRTADWSIALFCAWLATALILLSSTYLFRLLGPSVLTALERLMGMLLVALSVQMFLDGVTVYLHLGVS